MCVGVWRATKKRECAFKKQVFKYTVGTSEEWMRVLIFEPEELRFHWVRLKSCISSSTNIKPMFSKWSLPCFVCTKSEAANPARTTHAICCHATHCSLNISDELWHFQQQSNINQATVWCNVYIFPDFFHYQACNPRSQQQKQAAVLHSSTILYWERHLMAFPDWALISC